VSLASANDTRWGGTVGAGLEFGFAPNWSVGAEYNHIFLGGNDQNLTGGIGVLPVHVKQDVDMGLVRLNYKFGPGQMLGRY
jgi:outer membrane immunogenic protein